MVVEVKTRVAIYPKDADVPTGATSVQRLEHHAFVLRQLLAPLPGRTQRSRPKDTPI